MAIDYEAIARAGGFGKGPSRKEAKVRKRTSEADVIAAVRAEVFRLDAVCVVCGKPPGPSDAMHEILPRSKTRGMRPEERFNRRNCVRVHDGPGYPCHRDLTEHRTRIAFLDPRLGADGGLQISGATTAVYRRKEQRMAMNTKVTKPVTPTKRRPGAAKVVTK